LDTPSFNNRTNTCRVCGETTLELFQGIVLDLRVSYYECPHCSYVQTETPYWLERAYQNAINHSDTGIMSRNLTNARVALATLVFLKKTHGKMVDYAGGYGILVRLLRDYGVDAFWFDQYCRNLLVNGFEYCPEDEIDLVTVFEAFEHFVEPAKQLETLLAIAPNILLSTQIIPNPTPPLDNWWYYGRHHGQHIGFFRVKTLEFLAKKYNKHLSTDGHSFHLISDSKPTLKFWNMLIHNHVNKLAPVYARIFLRSKIASDNQKLSTFL